MSRPFKTFCVLSALLIAVPIAADAGTLTANVAFPAPAGSNITWTAEGLNSTAPQTYRFWIDDGSGWVVARDWAESHSFVWIPRAEGTYSIQVWARAAGSTTEFDDYAFAGPVTVTAPLPLTVTSFSPDVSTTPSVPVGTPMTWTAALSGGIGPHSYQFWADQGSGWVLLRDWSTASSFVWTPLAGTYTLLVTVRSADSTEDFDAYRYEGPVTVAPKPPLTLTFTLTPPPPVVEGTPITLSAVAGAGIPPYSYQFWIDRWGDAAGWIVLRDWSAANSVEWTPGPGFYDVLVWARDSTSSVATGFAKWTGVTVLNSVSLKLTSLTANVTFPVQPGTPVTWTLTAIGASAYRFDAFDTSTMPPVNTIVQDWSTDNTVIWPAGNYYLIGFARNTNGTIASLGAPVTVIPPLSLTSFTSTGSFEGGAAVTLSATASGGTGPYTYKFWADDGSGWVLLREWDTASSVVWTAPTGRYTLMVMARNAGSAAEYDAIRYQTRVQGSPLTLCFTSHTFPLTAGVQAGFLACPFGGTLPYSFQFWIDAWGDQEGWVLLRDWDTAASFNWTPPAAGVYDLLVWARSANSLVGETYRLTNLVVEQPAALSITSFAADARAPVAAGTPVTLTAAASGGIAPLNYRFWADADDGNGWILLRDWSTTNSFVWTPSTGTYTLLVTARGANSTADFDAYRYAGPVTVTPAPSSAMLQALSQATTGHGPK
jgi:N-acetylmuramoyl-L-alanine amidase